MLSYSKKLVMKNDIHCTDQLGLVQLSKPRESSLRPTRMSAPVGFPLVSSADYISADTCSVQVWPQEGVIEPFNRETENINGHS